MRGGSGEAIGEIQRKTENKIKKMSDIFLLLKK